MGFGSGIDAGVGSGIGVGSALGFLSCYTWCVLSGLETVRAPLGELDGINLD